MQYYVPFQDCAIKFCSVLCLAMAILCHPRGPFKLLRGGVHDLNLIFILFRVP